MWIQQSKLELSINKQNIENLQDTEFLVILFTKLILLGDTNLLECSSFPPLESRLIPILNWALNWSCSKFRRKKKESHKVVIWTRLYSDKRHRGAARHRDLFHFSTQINPNNYGEKTRLKLKTQGVSSLKKSVGLRSKLTLVLQWGLVTRGVIKNSDSIMTLAF